MHLRNLYEALLELFQYILDATYTIREDDTRISKFMEETMGEKPLTDLPPNILVEILSRLPLETLFICRRICRYFLHLISHNPDFFAAHSSNAPQIFLLQFRGYSRKYKEWRRLQLIEPEFDLSPKFDKSFQRHRFSLFAYKYGKKIFVANSCNGLLFFVGKVYNFNKVCTLVCNPVTNEYAMIREISVVDTLDTWREDMSMWLGFCPCSNQYKVLRIFINDDDGGGGGDVQAELLVVGSDLWMAIDGVLDWFDQPWAASNAFVDGVIHWIDAHSRGVLVYFDYKVEKFGEAPLPTFEVNLRRHQKDMKLGVLEGCVYLAYLNSHDHIVNIWIMKRDGNSTSWFKKYVINFQSINGQLNQWWGVPLQVLRSGEKLLLWLGDNLLCYDPRNCCLKIMACSVASWCESAVAFSPSFVPLKDMLKVDEAVVKCMRKQYTSFNA